MLLVVLEEFTAIQLMVYLLLLMESIWRIEQVWLLRIWNLYNFIQLECYHQEF